MGTKGKGKGKVAEREVAKLIKAWWGTIEPNVNFVRTPMSGGWSDDDTRSEFKATGDLMTTSKTFNFDVEVKRRESWSEDTLFAGQPSPVWKWWQQTQRAAMLSKREPMLWLRHNRRPWVVLLRDSYVNNLFRGYKVDSIPSTICSQCVTPMTKCMCADPRPGSGTLGAPMHRWGSELNAVNYGVAWPVAFLADALLAVNPHRFVLGGSKAPITPPQSCPKCGASPLMHVRGNVHNRRCPAKCGWQWEQGDHGSVAWCGVHAW